MKKKIAKTISIIELIKKFPNEEVSLKFFEDIIWKDGVKCSRCNDNRKITQQQINKNNYWCGKCRKYFNVKTNTPLENSNIKADKWMIAIYLILTNRKGVSSLQLSKEIGITQKSAWFMTQRIREACNSDNGLLSGIVEIDETYIGGKEKNKHANKKTKGTQGRSTKTKTAVVGMKQRDGSVKAKVFNKVNSDTLQTYINNNVKKGSTLSTDEAKFYRPITDYNKIMINHSVSEYVNGMASTNGIESVWAVLKRGYHGTFHHFSKKHMNRYVNEFTFRLNEGNCQIDTIDRITSLVSGMFGKTLSYKRLVGE